MANKYFAKLAVDNTVLNREVVSDGNAATEAKGIAFLTKVHGWPHWKEYFRTTESNPRKNPPQIGGTYDEGKDAFIPLKQHPSWVFNEATCNYEPPVALPADAWSLGGSVTYEWDEGTTNWVVVNFEGDFVPDPKA